MLDLLEIYPREFDRFPVEKAYGALLEYRRWHQSNSFEMGAIGDRVEDFLTRCVAANEVPKGGIKHLSLAPLSGKAAEGGSVLERRYSCRRFKDLVVPESVVEQILAIAQRAPSQCNRQSTKVHCYQQREDILRLLELQRGAKGFEEGVRNLFVISSDMTAWSGCNARNQSFVDGSLFAMHLSLACAEAGIGTCPLNLAVGNIRERTIKKAGGIPGGERLIMMMAFGYPAAQEQLVVAKSERLPVRSVLTMH
jgi:nitroreductase